MDPKANSQKPEVEQWVAIAVKLLTARDFNGTKAFAIRAKESDPDNPISGQILAVVDTLLAADNKFNGGAQFDWYSILQLPSLARDPDLISTHYRRLLVLLDPPCWNGIPFADLALRLVVDAWSVLSDPTKKWLYDSEIGLYLQRFQPQRVEPVRVDPPQMNTFQFFQQKPPQQQQQRPEMQFQGRQEMWQRQQQQQGLWQWEPTLPPSQQQGHRKGEADVERNEGSADAVDVNAEANGNVQELDTFWTACPYCFYMYEYPQVYKDCALRCQNCRRGFHAAVIPNPPPIDDGGGKEASSSLSFCCWGFYPLGFSLLKWKRNNTFGDPKGFADWVPFSPTFTCSVNGNAGGGLHENAVPRKKTTGRKTGGCGSEPRTIVEDDEVDVDFSDSDTSNDFDWRSTRKRKKKKNKWRGRKVGFGRRGRVGRKPNVLKEKAYGSLSEENGALGGEGLKVRSQVTGGYPPVVLGLKSDASNRPGSSNTRKQMRKVGKDRGKLDLNVELSNEVEDHAPTVSPGNGQEEPIEGIAFFEGLDEFLSSFPILNVAKDEKN